MRDLAAYQQRLRDGQSPCAFREHLEPEAKARETLVMALRQTAGLTGAEFQQTTGFDLRALCGDTLDALAREGLLEVTPERVKLTESGLFVSDGIFAELV